MMMIVVVVVVVAVVVVVVVVEVTEYGNVVQLKHCCGKTTIPMKVATTHRENRHRQDAQQGTEIEAKGEQSIGCLRKRQKDQLHHEG
jgi:hypothetical protein